MDLDEVRRLLDSNYFRHGVSLMTRFDFSFKSFSKVPQVVSDIGADVLRVILQGSQYVADHLKEAQNPKVLRSLSCDEVSECHREIGIIHGYRNENCSVLQAVMSLFRVTNETVNFWTHFLPSIYFVWLFLSLSYSMPLFSDEYLFPFVCYMISSCAYPLMSCLAHAFSCLSPTAQHVCFFMDYATLSVYSWGAAILYYNYAFPHVMFASLYASLFLPVAALMAISATLMTCFSRLMACNSFGSKMLRISAFVIPYLWVSLPLIWRLFHCEEDTFQYINEDQENTPSTADTSCTESGVHYRRQFLSVVLASFFYGSHIPERFAPGRFDFIGHSHNLLHLFGVAATYEQIRGALIDVQSRRAELRSMRWSFSTGWIAVGSPLLVVVNVAIIIAFTYVLVHKNNTKQNAIQKQKGRRRR